MSDSGRLMRPQPLLGLGRGAAAALLELPYLRDLRRREAVPGDQEPCLALERLPAPARAAAGPAEGGFRLGGRVDGLLRGSEVDLAVGEQALGKGERNVV